MKTLIISLIVLAIIAAAVLFFIRKTKKAKAEEKQKRAREMAAKEKKNIELGKNIYPTISVTKLSIPDDFLSQIITFETCWDNEKIFVKCPTDGHWQVIKNFLERQKELLPKAAENENAFLEFKAYSKNFLEKWISIAKKKEFYDTPGDFWRRFFSNIYKKDSSYRNGKLYCDLDIKTNHELFFEFMLADFENETDPVVPWNTMSDIDTLLQVRLFIPKLESSDFFKKIIQEEKDRYEKKTKAELEEFRTNGVIDEKLLTFIKTHPNPTDRLLAREVFDEIVLKDLKRKFFPDQDLSSISPELAIKLAQAYLNFTLKILE